MINGVTPSSVPLIGAIIGKIQSSLKMNGYEMAQNGPVNAYQQSPPLRTTKPARKVSFED